MKCKAPLVVCLSLAVIGISSGLCVAGHRNAVEVEGEKFMVVAVSPPAVEAGAEVLAEGGSAVDAAVTVALAMAVTYPPAGNIGGGGFMMIHPPGATDEAVCIDYREVAPAAATVDMFQLGETRFSRKIVGVPGTLRGLELAHKKYGKLPWKRLVEPAIELAEQGFELDAALAESLTAVWAADATRPMSEFRRVFAPPDGKAWREGDRLVQSDLASTMETIRDHGAAGFYEGRVADLLVQEMKRHDGLITHSDLKNYKAVIRKPVRTTFRGYDILGPPPPSSGGTAICEMLNILENFDLRSKGPLTADSVHLTVEAMRRAYLDRARYLGDPDFAEIPPKLVSKSYAAELASQISPMKATDSLKLAPEIPVVAEGPSTTHFSVIDGSGLAVSNTYTLEYPYGSRVIVQGAGFLLNNEMGDFNWKPGHTDTLGRIGTKANIVAPGKRMLSSQTPTIVARDNKAVVITGSPGGRTIINTVLNVLLNRLEYRLSPAECVSFPRFHHQWLPDQIRYEQLDDEYPTLKSKLRQRGHNLSDGPRRQGDAHSIFIDEETGVRTGVADPRINGLAVGDRGTTTCP